MTAGAAALARWWSRPLPEEVRSWTSEGLPEDLPVVARVLLDEYERLFVGPGQVPCPPYESFWREDVPIDLRRSLMGPCTAELRGLYAELGLEVSPASGELPDHVAVELEALCCALASEGTVGIAEAIFSEHLRRWLPRLCRAVAHEAVEPFYRFLAAASLDWLAEAETRLGMASKERRPDTSQAGLRTRMSLRRA